MNTFYGWVAAFGFIGLALTIWLTLALRRDRILPRRVVLDVPDMVRRGKRDEALAACRQRRSVLGNIWCAALEYAAAAGQPDPSVLAEVLDGEMRRQWTLIQARASYLLDIMSAALLVGLFLALCGIAYGLAPSGFDALATPPDALSEALCAASASVGTGLAVGVIALAAYALFRGYGAPALDEVNLARRDIFTLLISGKE